MLYAMKCEFRRAARFHLYTMFAVPGFRFANPSLLSAIPTPLIPAKLFRSQIGIAQPAPQAD